MKQEEIWICCNAWVLLYGSACVGRDAYVRTVYRPTLIQRVSAKLTIEIEAQFRVRCPRKSCQ